MKTSTALSNGNQRVFFPFISRLSKSLAHGAFSRLIVLTALLWSVLVTSAFAEGVAANNTAGLTFWAHLVVTAFAFIFAMKLAAAAFARPPRQLADIPTGPKYLTSPGYYMFGLVIFTLLAASLFLLLLYLHTEVIAVVDLIKLPFLRVSISNTVIEAIANDTAPYLLIVFIMAALYLYLMRKEAEWNILLMLRDVIHIWIAIPYRVRAIVAQVSHTFNVPEPFANEVVRRRLGVRKEDFEKDPSTFERPWAELSYIQWWLTRQLESGEAGFFNDSEFKLDELLTEYASLSTDVARFRDDRASHVTDAAALVPRLKVLRNKSARVVGCYLVHRYGVDDRLDRAALDFGIQIEATSNENPLKYIVIYLITLSLSVYVGVYVSAILFDWLSGTSLESAVSSQDDNLVWRWVSYASANYGLAIAVILVIRYIAWKSSNKANVAYLSTYCWTGLVAFFVGPLGLTVAVKLYQVQRFVDMSFISTFATELKWGLGPAIIAVFISYYMDRQTSSALPNINQSHNSVGWRIAVSLLVALITIVLLLPPLLSLQAATGSPWGTDKLHAVAIGTTFIISFGLALTAQFALRKPQASTASVPVVDVGNWPLRNAHGEAEESRPPLTARS